MNIRRAYMIERKYSSAFKKNSEVGSARVAIPHSELGKLPPEDIILAYKMMMALYFQVGNLNDEQSDRLKIALSRLACFAPDAEALHLNRLSQKKHLGLDLTEQDQEDLTIFQQLVDQSASQSNAMLDEYIAELRQLHSNDKLFWQKVCILIGTKHEADILLGGLSFVTNVLFGTMWK